MKRLDHCLCDHVHNNYNDDDAELPRDHKEKGQRVALPCRGSRGKEEIIEVLKSNGLVCCMTNIFNYKFNYLLALSSVFVSS